MITFHKVQAGEYRAYGDTLIYDVVKDTAPGVTQWYVRVHELKRTAPEENVSPRVYAGERVAHAVVETKSLAYSVAQHFDALGDDYAGAVSRMTCAQVRAYDDYKTVTSPDLVESLAQMRRGEGKEV